MKPFNLSSQNRNPVTGLMDMFSFQKKAGQIIHQYPQEQLVVIYFDIDNFKLYNTYYGHEKGDASLRFITKTMKKIFADGVLCHLGDDHFAILAQRDGVLDKLNELYHLVRNHDDRVFIELKAGIATTRIDEKVLETIDKARIACDTLKGRYDRHIIEYEDIMEEELLKRKYIIDHLESAIEQKRIQVYYMPIVRILTNELCGLEALARWNDDTYHLITPGMFIETLEEAHLIHLLDLEIARQVVEKLADMIESGKQPVPVSINLSRLDFTLCDIVGQIDAIVSGYHVPREYIDIEVTERALSEDDGTLHIALEQFKILGYKLWMDDFGSGFSSLNVLKNYDFDVLKIDMAFLMSASKNAKEKGKVVIKSIINMAKELGIQTLCEGIESKENVELLKQLGCEKGQGYYFYPPSSFAEITEHIPTYTTDIETAEKRYLFDKIGTINMNTETATVFIQKKENTSDILYMNPAFKEFLNQIEMKEDYFIHQIQSPRARVQNRIDSAIALSKKSHHSEFVDVILNGVYCNLEIETLACQKNPACTYYTVRAINISRITSYRNSGYLDHLLRSIYSLFDRVDLLDIDNNVVRQLYQSTGQYEESYDGLPIASSIQKYAQSFIYHEDRQSYLDFYDIDSIRQRIYENGQNYMFQFFRAKKDDGTYGWQIFVVILVELDGADKILTFCFHADEKGVVIAKEFAHIQIDSSNANPLRKQSRYIESEIFDEIPIGIFWKDTNRRFLGANTYFKEYYGFHHDRDFIGKTDEEMGWHVDPNPFMNHEIQVIQKGESFINQEGHCIARGKLRNIRASKVPYIKDGEIIGLIGYFIDCGDDMTKPLSSKRQLQQVYDLYVNAFVAQAVNFGILKLEMIQMERFYQKYDEDQYMQAIMHMRDILDIICGKDASIHQIHENTFIILKQVSDETLFLQLYEHISQAMSRFLYQHLEMDIVMEKWMYYDAETKHVMTYEDILEE